MSRIDKDGRDVTHLPGLWSEDDRQEMNIDEAIEFAGELTNDIAREQEPGMLVSEIAVIILAAEVNRLREFTEAQRRDNEQLRDRLKVLES